MSSRHCLIAPGEAVGLGGWRNNSLAAESAPAGATPDGVRGARLRHQAPGGQSSMA
jgi:hypothetical protein